MKRLIIGAIFFTLLASLTSLWGQSPHKMSGEQLTPKQIAARKAAFLEKELLLSEKQTRKVYSLYLKQVKKEQSDVSSQSHSWGGRPSFGGPPPGGRGFGERGGRPPQHEGGDFERPDRERKGPRPVAYQESEEDIAKREKKMKKILSEEQYGKWRQLEEGMRKNEKDKQRKEELKRTFPELDLDQLKKDQQKDIIDE